MNFYDLPAPTVVALCIWGEARGEPIEGQIAVACVIRNRAVRLQFDWWGVCLAPQQFSCFNTDDPNYQKITRAAAMLVHGVPTPALAQAGWIADGVVRNLVLDNTHGAQNYLTTALLLSDRVPTWAKNRPILAHYGAHTFLTA